MCVCYTFSLDRDHGDHGQTNNMLETIFTAQ